MSRQRRRAAQPLQVLSLKGGCPDCDADLDLIDHGAGHVVCVIRHDPTCPYFARLQEQP